MKRFLLVLCCVASGTIAQVTNIEAPGNLKSEHDVGCISVEEVAADFSPADLFGGISECHRDRSYDKAVELMIVAQLRGEFDKLRVADKTAHQAMQVLALQTQDAGGRRYQRQMQEAFQRFGGTGSPHHTKLCQQVKQQGLPRHSPSYMIQHGMKAITGFEGDGLVDDFNDQRAWDNLLKSYLKCSG